MTLPKLDKPIFELEVPSTGKKIKYTCFTVKQEKILLIAQEAKDQKDILNAVTQIVEQCVLDPIDSNKLIPADLEYIFLKLRARSVNNIVELKYRDKEDNKVYDFDLDLDSIVPSKPNKKVSNKVMLSKDIGIEVRWPNIEDVSFVADNIKEKEEAETFYKMLSRCIIKLWDATKVYDLSTVSEEEMNEFMGQLTFEHTSKIKEYFDQMPKLKHTLKYKNSMGNDRTIELEGLQDFFQ